MSLPGSPVDSVKVSLPVSPAPDGVKVSLPGSPVSAGVEMAMPGSPSPADSGEREQQLPEEAAAVGLDPALVAEELQLREDNERTTRNLQRKLVEQASREEREHRYARLMKLLEHSQFYVRYLSEKLESDRIQVAAQAKVSRKSKPRVTKNACKQRKRKLSESNCAVSADNDAPCSSQSSQEDPNDAALCEAPQPKLLEGATLRDYQLQGYNWLRVMYTNGVNCILGDEMGLGKTIQAISVIAHLVEQGVSGPFLVVAPLSTLSNWLSELHRFSPRLPALLYHGVQRRDLLPRLRTPDTAAVLPVVLTSYEVAIRDSRQLANFEWKYLVVDEGHRLKNYQCRLVSELKRYRVYNRLLLTGTPLQNNLAELWSLLNFLLPEIFDDLAVFESWFDADALSDVDADARLVASERETHVLATLRSILSPFLLRRLKSDVALQIPPKREVLVYCPMVERQAEMYRATSERTIERLLLAREDSGGICMSEENKENAQCEDSDDSDKIRKPRPKRKCRSNADFKFMFAQRDNLDNWQRGVERLAEARQEAARCAHEVSLGSKDSHVHLPLQSVVMVLRHIANHPFLIEHPVDPQTQELQLVPDVAEYSGKLKVLHKLLHGLFDKSADVSSVLDPVGAELAAATACRKVLIFSQFRMMLSVLSDFLTVQGWRYVMLDGTHSVAERQEAIDAFNRPLSAGGIEEPVRVFLLSTRAGGLGINLAAADTVIIYDSDWNPQRDLQAQDRAHRLGQHRPVVVYRLLTAGTIDERIVRRAAGKRKLERVVLSTSSAAKRSRTVRGTRSLAISQEEGEAGFGDRLRPEELVQLLQDTSSQQVVRTDGAVLSSEQLRSLLDRSQLYREWKHQS